MWSRNCEVFILFVEKYIAINMEVIDIFSCFTMHNFNIQIPYSAITLKLDKDLYLYRDFLTN